jgi:hypothetical protein
MSRLLLCMVAIALLGATYYISVPEGVIPTLVPAQAPPTPPVPPITPIPPPVASCAGFPVVLPVSATWGQSYQFQSSLSGAFGSGATTVWLFTLTVPAGTANSTVIGSFSLSEYQGPETPRQMTISKTPCDFRAKDYTGGNGPIAVANGSRVTIYYGVEAPSLYGPAALAAGQTYYVSARNWELDPVPANSCPSVCNAIMNFQPAAP